jgi:hypothetical protein
VKLTLVNRIEDWVDPAVATPVAKVAQLPSREFDTVVFA